VRDRRDGRQGRPRRALLGSALALAWAGAALAETAAPGDAALACRSAEAEPATVASVGADGDVLLADGRVVALPGLRWLDPLGEEPSGPARLGAMLPPGTTVAVGGGATDRWGRLRAQLRLPDGSLAAAALVSAGAAIVMPEDLESACAEALQQLEQGAREAETGSWRGGSEGPWPAGEPGLARQFSGRYALFQGRIRSIGDRNDRFYLDFGRFGEDTLVVTIRKRTLNRLAAWGKRVTSLEGRRVRVRGVVLDGRQPVIEVTVPGQIERLD
jgi:hypothetical protein